MFSRLESSRRFLWSCLPITMQGNTLSGLILCLSSGVNFDLNFHLVLLSNW